MRVLALDHGEARCGCALSDPTGILATPLEVVERPDSPAGLEALAGLIAAREVDRVVVGLPLTLAGEEGHQAERARAFAERLAAEVDVPVELHDERLTTRRAEQAHREARGGAERRGGADPDSRAAAHLLESWLASRSASR